MDNSLFIEESISFARSVEEMMIAQGVRWSRPLAAAFGHGWSRGISTHAARSTLGFAETHRPTLRELRHAYFEAAKRCHPDVATEQDAGRGFRIVTEAYEHLLRRRDGYAIQCDGEDLSDVVTLSEEEVYRHACEAILGLPAEIVEETKRNPTFRRWLSGNTNSAKHWRNFFSGHGGLAQKLRLPVGYLCGGCAGKGGVVRKSETRRKRRRRCDFCCNANAFSMQYEV